MLPYCVALPLAYFRATTCRPWLHLTIRESKRAVNPFSMDKGSGKGRSSASSKAHRLLINATQHIKEASKKAVVHQNIISFKDSYDTLLGERGVTLSGGQIQRISIARALIKNSKILLLDDCLSAVDTDTEEEILKNLKNVSTKKTTVIVSHRISSLKHADKIIVLENGEIIQQGKHSDLIESKGYYKELFKKQQTERVK